MRYLLRPEWPQWPGVDRLHETSGTRTGARRGPTGGNVGVADLDADRDLFPGLAERAQDITPDSDDQLRALLREFLDRPAVPAGQVLIFSEAETIIDYLPAVDPRRPRSGDRATRRHVATCRGSSTSHGRLRMMRPRYGRSIWFVESLVEICPRGSRTLSANSRNCAWKPRCCGTDWRPCANASPSTCRRTQTGAHPGRRK